MNEKREQREKDEPKSLREIKREMWKDKTVVERWLRFWGRSSEARRIDIEACGVFTKDVIMVLSGICDGLERQGGSVEALCSKVGSIRPKTWGGKALIDCVRYVSGAGQEPRGPWESMHRWEIDREERGSFEIARGCVERKDEALPCVVSDGVCGAVAAVLNQMVESGRVVWPPERERLEEYVPMGKQKRASRSL